MWQFRSCAFLLTSADPYIIAFDRRLIDHVEARRDVAGPQSSEIAAITPFVMRQLPTPAIVADEVTSTRVALASLSEGVIMNFKQKLMACTALLGVWLFHPATAGAQSAEAQKIERLERQTELLQRQLKEIQEELARTRKRTEKVEAKVEAAPARYSAPPPMVTKGPPPPPPPERVKVTLGGFVAAETVWRQHNMVNDIGTAFATTPYPFSPLYNEHEFHGTARQSRISLLVEGNIDPYQKLSGYYESDFLGVGNTSNYNQSNSWAPRLRHAYFTYDNTGWGGWGFHILAGQTWSLATQNQVDMTPRKENIPLTIDANYVVGFNYIRQWQIRGVVDVAPGIALGESGIRSRLGPLRNIRAAAVLQRQPPEMRLGAVRRGLDCHGGHRRQQDHVRRGCGRFGVAAAHSEISRIHRQRSLRTRRRPLRGRTAAGCHHRCGRLALAGDRVERDGGPYRPSVGRARPLRLRRPGGGRGELLQHRHDFVRPWQSGLQQCHLLRDDAVLIFRRHAHRLHRQQQAVIRNNGGLLAECLQGRLWPRDLRSPIRVHQT